jgi:hypothetical protein
LDDVFDPDPFMASFNRSGGPTVNAMFFRERPITSAFSSPLRRAFTVSGYSVLEELRVWAFSGVDGNVAAAVHVRLVALQGEPGAERNVLCAAELWEGEGLAQRPATELISGLTTSCPPQAAATATMCTDSLALFT